MTKDDIALKLHEKGYTIESNKRLGNDSGDQIKIGNGCILN